MSSALLARYADHIFWMARYVERAENLARILDVNQSTADDRSHLKDWRAVIEINSDQERFFASHRAADGDTVIQYYVLDIDNPTSILATVRAARENARTLRPFISTEMWTQLNIFYNGLKALTPADLAPPALPRLFSHVKEGCQTHTGITEGTFHRDQGWYFYQLGRYIERADQTTRLVDVKFRRAAADGQSSFEAGRWAALLRSAAGYHAFRRVSPRGLVPAEIAGFLLFNEGFPRSVRLCTDEASRLLYELCRQHQLKGGGAALERLDELQGALAQARSRPAAIVPELHDFVDRLQHQFIAISDALAADFFGR